MKKNVNFVSRNENRNEILRKLLLRLVKNVEKHRKYCIEYEILYFI